MCVYVIYYILYIYMCINVLYHSIRLHTVSVYIYIKPSFVDFLAPTLASPGRCFAGGQGLGPHGAQP